MLKSTKKILLTRNQANQKRLTWMQKTMPEMFRKSLARTSSLIPLSRSTILLCMMLLTNKLKSKMKKKATPVPKQKTQQMRF